MSAGKPKADEVTDLRAAFEECERIDLSTMPGRMVAGNILEAREVLQELQAEIAKVQSTVTPGIVGALERLAELGSRVELRFADATDATMRSWRQEQAKGDELMAAAISRYSSARTSFLLWAAAQSPEVRNVALAELAWRDAAVARFTPWELPWKASEEAGVAA